VNEVEMPNLLSPALIDAIARNAEPLKALLGLDEHTQIICNQDICCDEHGPKIFIGCNVTIPINHAECGQAKRKCEPARRDNAKKTKGRRQVPEKYFVRNKHDSYRFPVK